MPRRAPVITQADVVRAIRAAKEAGAEGVQINPDGTILILLSAPQVPAEPPTVEEDDIVL